MAKKGNPKIQIVSGQSPHDKPQSKGAHIRAYINRHKSKAERMPSAIRRGLLDLGIEATTGHISLIKSEMKKKAERRRGAKVTAKVASTKVSTSKSNPVNIDQLLAAKEFLAKCNNDVLVAKESMSLIQKLT